MEELRYLPSHIHLPLLPLDQVPLSIRDARQNNCNCLTTRKKAMIRTAPILQTHQGSLQAVMQEQVLISSLLSLCCYRGFKCFTGFSAEQLLYYHRPSGISIIEGYYPSKEQYDTSGHEIQLWEYRQGKVKCGKCHKGTGQGPCRPRPLALLLTILASACFALARFASSKASRSNILTCSRASLTR